jgi:hypothetical protein
MDTTTRSEEFYTLTINGVSGEHSKNYVLAIGCEQLGLPILQANPFNYDILKDTWSRSEPIPTETDIKTAAILWAEAQEKLKYKQQRRMAYPDWSEQLAYIYDKGIEKWKTDIVDPVKAKYPKPST